MFGDGLADDVSWCEFPGGVEVGHEAVSIAIDEVSSFAADCFGDEVSGAAGDIEDGGVELHEFHITEFAAGADCGGMSISGGDEGIGGFAIEGACAAGAEDGLFGPDEGASVVGVPDESAAAGAGFGEEVEDKGFFPEVDM